MKPLQSIVTSAELKFFLRCLVFMGVRLVGFTFIQFLWNYGFSQLSPLFHAMSFNQAALLYTIPNIFRQYNVITYPNPTDEELQKMGRVELILTLGIMIYKVLLPLLSFYVLWNYGIVGLCDNLRHVSFIQTTFIGVGTLWLLG